MTTSSTLDMLHLPNVEKSVERCLRRRDRLSTKPKFNAETEPLHQDDGSAERREEQRHAARLRIVSEHQAEGGLPSSTGTEFRTGRLLLRKNRQPVQSSTSTPVVIQFTG